MNSQLSRQTPAGPITAIASSLSTRSAPSVPPASQEYEPAIKAILARRFVWNVLAVSAAAGWILAALWTAWQLGGLDSIGVLGWLANWLSPLTVVCALLWWSFASAPIAVLRKSHTKANYIPTLSPRQALFQHASESQYQQALLVTLVSSIFLAIFHSLLAQTIEKGGRGDPKLGIWAGSKKHPYHLNGRFCFLFLSQTTCALLYWLRDVLKTRYHVRWSSQTNLFPLLISSAISICLISAVSSALSLLVFATLRGVALPVLYRLPVIHNCLRPFIAHFFRPVYTITFMWSNFDMILRAFFLAVSGQILWDVPSTMFDVTFSVPSMATETRKDSGLVLVSGISSADAYLQLHAFHELCDLASGQEQMTAKRAVIFNDTKHSPNLWSTLVHRSLLLLGSDYQRFFRRGNLPQPLQAPGNAETIPSVAHENPLSTVIRDNIFKPPQTTPISQLAETFSSDGAVTRAFSQKTSDTLGLVDVFGPTVRSWQRSVSIAVPAKALDAPAGLTSFSSLLSHPAWFPMHDIGRWWRRERSDRSAQMALPNKELDSMIVRVLSNLISQSLREDTLGHVQRDIPRIIEAMLLFLSAIEDYQVELAGTLTGASNGVGSHEVSVLTGESALASEWVEDLSSELRAGISLIVSTFGDRLTKFKFPPNIAVRLQTFVDYI